MKRLKSGRTKKGLKWQTPDLRKWVPCAVCIRVSHQNMFLAVHNSSIGDLVTHSLTDFYFWHYRVTIETLDQSDEESWPDQRFDNFWQFLTIFDNFDHFRQFWQLLTFLTIFERFDNFDNFQQCGRFSTILTISDNFDNLNNFWNFFDNSDHFYNFVYNFDNFNIFLQFWQLTTILTIQTIAFAWRLVTFETLITILTIENLNSWQSLLPDN